MFCANPNPWDNSILCGLPEGHDGIHEAREYHGGSMGWAERCHFPGDDCGPAAHDDRMDGAA